MVDQPQYDDTVSGIRQQIRDLRQRLRGGGAVPNPGPADRALDALAGHVDALAEVVESQERRLAALESGS